ncbi:hypothetical protein CPAV1605_739 [seawater metagenome]|uniref:SWIM-type domain-containing protein n=1 Tax=seawater metagenome TaxID=1561972 RepID=A0A5E8CK29_9ZZZZ
MDIEQYSRYKKLNYEIFYLLDWREREEEFWFAISGSSFNIYNITISKIKNNIICTCRDFIDNCIDNKLICKHCCFILFTVIKLYYKYSFKIDKIRLNRPQGYNTINESEFFNKLVFSFVEIILIGKKIKRLYNNNFPFQRKDLTQKYRLLMLIEDQKRIFYKQFTKFKIPLDTEILCGVCLKIIDDKPENKYLSCPECRKFIHLECAKAWLQKKETCVYCRSNIWENYCYFEYKKQLNLLKQN